jgi:hypothetical protein
VSPLFPIVLERVQLTRFPSEELFYQLGLRQFGRFVRIKLKPPPPLRDLIRLAVEHEEGRPAAKMSTDEIVEVSERVFRSSSEGLVQTR